MDNKIDYFEVLGIALTQVEEYIATEEAVKEAVRITNGDNPSPMAQKGLAMILLLAPNLKSILTLLKELDGAACDKHSHSSANIN